MIFRSVMGYDMSWDAPKDLNEKINWMKLYADTTEWVRLSDKYLVRQYITEKGLQDILVPLLGKWDNVDDIDWGSLPEKFVMKMNNGSGDILICKNKSELDIKHWNKKFKQLFKTKFGLSMGEFQYMKMKPCIIAEELLDVKKQPIDTDTLIDYKIWCFHGKPFYVWACYNRHEDTVEVATYDLEWKRHDEKSVFTKHYIRAKQDLPRPVSLYKMLEIAAILSKGIPQVRVDLYEVEGKPYFGEMTFTSNSGYMDFYTRDFMLELGKEVNLERK